MPGWYIHLSAAKRAAEMLSLINTASDASKESAPPPISSFKPSGPTPQELVDIIRKYPNYYALGAIGPDIFFFLPDFKGKTGNFVARLAEWIIETYDLLDEKVFSVWENTMGPIEQDNAEEISRLTGGLSDTIDQISSYISSILNDAILDFMSRLYDWFTIFGSGVPHGYDDKLFFWSDMFHYRRTNEFARDLLLHAQENSYDDSDPGNRYKYEPGVAFALGWMTHVATDTTGHDYVNEKTGGPYRLHWQRHHLVENHMDSFVYNAQNGSKARYNMMAFSCLHFWLQFNADNNYAPDFDFFQEFDPNAPKHFPDYPLGQTSRDSYNRKKAVDVDSTIPPGLANLIMDTMKSTFYDRHVPSKNGGMPTHPTILAPVASPGDGRPDYKLLKTTYELLFKYVKYVTTDYYKMAKPQPPDIFPNLSPPMPPGNDDAPGESDSNWSFWDWLLAILAWILYIADWIAYVATLIPAIIADLATYPARVALYPIEEGLYEIWKAFRYLLVMEGFVMPEPDEIDLGLVQLGLPSNGPYVGLLAIMNDVAGGLWGDNPNPVPPSEPVRDRLYPRQIVKDDPSFLSQFFSDVSSLFPSRCNLPPPADPKQPSEYLRPWEYPLFNNDHSPIGMEPSSARASPHVVGSVPTVLIGGMVGADAARHAYENAQTPEETDGLNLKLNSECNLGDPVHYSLYVIGQLTRDEVDIADIASFNLDSDRGYGYKCWDWNRQSQYVARYDGDADFEYKIPCTPPEQFDKYDTCGTGTPTSVPMEYNPALPLQIHYLKLLSEGDSYPGCIHGAEPMSRKRTAPSHDSTQATEPR